MNLQLIVICTLIALATFLFWEFVAWFSHKYIMHGFLWRWHKSHHTLHHHTLEQNDLFALVFSLPCVFLFYYFSKVHFNPYMLAVATGIFFYGAFYFIFHDIIVHQRIKWNPSKKNKYLQRIIHAHYIHHSKHTKDGCEAFGFLMAPRKYQPKQFITKKSRQETQ